MEKLEKKINCGQIEEVIHQVQRGASHSFFVAFSSPVYTWFQHASVVLIVSKFGLGPHLLTGVDNQKTHCDLIVIRSSCHPPEVVRKRIVSGYLTSVDRSGQRNHLNHHYSAL